jgi:hypothetical protein
MLYKEIIAVCSQIRTKYINTLCGQNVEFLDVKTDGTLTLDCEGLIEKFRGYWGEENFIS